MVLTGTRILGISVMAIEVSKARGNTCRLAGTRGGDRV